MMMDIPSMVRKAVKECGRCLEFRDERAGSDGATKD
jgi:hypothetical protein